MANLKKIKSVDNAILFEDEKGQPFIRIDKVRLSYPFIGTPSEDEDDNGNKKQSYRLTGMLPKATHTAAKDLCKEVIMKLIKDNDAKVPADKWFLTNGDDKEDENMHDHFLISASDGKIRPKVRDRKGQIMDDIEKIDETFYGGCWGHILIRPWFFNGKGKNGKTYPKRVSAGLTGVFFYKDDKPFGSGRIDESDAWGGLGDHNDDGMDDDDSGL